MGLDATREAINTARSMTGWRDFELVADTAAAILAGPDAGEAALTEARRLVVDEMTKAIAKKPDTR